MGWAQTAEGGRVRNARDGSVDRPKGRAGEGVGKHRAGRGGAGRGTAGRGRGGKGRGGGSREHYDMTPDTMEEDEDEYNDENNPFNALRNITNETRQYRRTTK